MKRLKNPPSPPKSITALLKTYKHNDAFIVKTIDRCKFHVLASRLGMKIKTKSIGKGEVMVWVIKEYNAQETL